MTAKKQSKRLVPCWRIGFIPQKRRVPLINENTFTFKGKADSFLGYQSQIIKDSFSFQSILEGSLLERLIRDYTLLEQPS